MLAGVGRLEKKSDRNSKISRYTSRPFYLPPRERELARTLRVSRGMQIASNGITRGRLYEGVRRMAGRRKKFFFRCSTDSRERERAQQHSSLVKIRACQSEVLCYSKGEQCVRCSYAPSRLARCCSAFFLPPRERIGCIVADF